MHNIETYNRVRCLESPRLKRLATYRPALLLLALLACLASTLINQALDQFTVIFVAGAMLCSLAIFLFDKRRIPHCQHCNSPLDYVVRPFLLNSKYLAMHGTKKGDYFYTFCRWGTQPLTQRWAKISRRSLACHHCRLTEERMIEHFDTVSDSELQDIHTTLVKPIAK
jgi:hypothetical protein